MAALTTGTLISHKGAILKRFAITVAAFLLLAATASAQVPYQDVLVIVTTNELPLVRPCPFAFTYVTYNNVRYGPFIADKDGHVMLSLPQGVSMVTDAFWSEKATGRWKGAAGAVTIGQRPATIFVLVGQ